ncbi:GMC oxidoreductase [Streptomyces sp. MN13]
MPTGCRNWPSARWRRAPSCRAAWATASDRRTDGAAQGDFTSRARVAVGLSALSLVLRCVDPRPLTACRRRSQYVPHHATHRVLRNSRGACRATRGPCRSRCEEGRASSCTVRMGADDDPSAPLDARLRGKGVEGLRVADGSVMPDLVTVNPCITTMVIGEKCADPLKDDR